MSRCKYIGLCGAVALLVPAGMAWAQGDHPLYLPTRDVAVTYNLDSHGQGAAKQAHLYYSASTDRLRLDRPNLRGFVIIDRKAKTMTVVLGEPHVYFVQPLGREFQSGFILSGDMQFVRGANESIAGQTCTDWTVDSSTVTGTACVTKEGVLLRSRGRTKNGATGGGLQAAEVSYDPQPLALFMPPAGFKQIDIAQAAGALAK